MISHAIVEVDAAGCTVDGEGDRGDGVGDGVAGSDVWEDLDGVFVCAGGRGNAVVLAVSYEKNQCCIMADGKSEE